MKDGLRKTYTRYGKVENYWIDGRKVTREEYEQAEKTMKRKAERAAKKRGLQVTLSGVHKGWPIVSHALGVHKDQIGLAKKLDRDVGAPPTEYTPDGEPILRDRGHRRDYLKAHQMHDRDAGYGD